jgi:hypothetical protein
MSVKNVSLLYLLTLPRKTYIFCPSYGVRVSSPKGVLSSLSTARGVLQKVSGGAGGASWATVLHCVQFRPPSSL